MPPSRGPKDAPAPTEGILSRQLRAMIQARGGSAESLANEAGVDPAALRRFLGVGNSSASTSLTGSPRSSVSA